jgi:hypothetical protein
MSSFKSAQRLCLLATMFVLAVLNTSSEGIAFAQIPEAPGTYIEPNGNIEHPVELPRGGPRKPLAAPQPEPTSDPALDTINVMERARARAGGTPVPEPTPRNSLSGPQ